MLRKVRKGLLSKAYFLNNIRVQRIQSKVVNKKMRQQINKKKWEYFNKHNFCDKNQGWVSQEIQDIKEDQLVAECQSIKRREPSKKPDPQPTLSSLMTSPESEESESEEVTTSSEPSDLRKVTSTGPPKPPPEKPESSTSYTMPQTTSWSEPRPSLRTVLSPLTLPHSPNGMSTITESTWSPERARKERSRKRQDQPNLKPESLKDKKTELSTSRSLNNSANKDFWPVSAQDRANLAELMVIFWKENNSSSTLRRLNQERNDMYHSYSFYQFDLSLGNSLIFTGIVVCLYILSSQQHPPLAFLGFYFFYSSLITLFSFCYELSMIIDSVFLIFDSFSQGSFEALEVYFLAYVLAEPFSLVLEKLGLTAYFYLSSQSFFSSTSYILLLSVQALKLNLAGLKLGSIHIEITFKNSVSIFSPVFAEISQQQIPNCSAFFIPSSTDTSLSRSKSILFPTIIIIPFVLFSLYILIHSSAELNVSLHVTSNNIKAHCESFKYEGISDRKRYCPAVSHNCKRQFLFLCITFFARKSIPTVG